MAAQLRPNRMAVTDRFPMLGFTIRVGRAPSVAEVAIATDPALFTRKEGRTSSTFYTSREDGLLSIPRDETVFMVPPVVLARFVGAQRLWFGLATAASPAADNWTVDVLPNTNSPYISLSGLSDRALRRVRMFPARGSARAKGPLLNWAGDSSQPGATAMPAPAAPGATAAAPQPAVQPASPHNDTHYDDGFGPLPPLHAAPPANPVNAATSAIPAAPAPVAATPLVPATAARPAVSQGMGANSNTWSRGLSADPEAYGIDTPPYSDDDGSAAAPTAAASALALGARENSLVTRTEASPNFDEGRGGTTIDRIIIHIADVPTVQRVVNTFTNAASKVSSHYLVGPAGEVVQFVSEADTAWHCKGSNKRSIGIEHIAVKRGGADYPRPNGTVQHFDAQAPTQLEYETSAALVSSLCDKYQLPVNRSAIMGHREADTSTGHTSCPDGNWDWDYFMRLVTSRTCQPQGASQALAFRARALSDDIPLDPGVGGLSIGTSALEIGDIILSTTGHASSAVIRAGSGAEISHAMLYVGQGGQVIESTGAGVQLRPLADALADSRLAVAFRVPNLTDTQKQQVADAAARYLDRSYNYVGLIRIASYQIDRHACDLLSGDAAERCRRFIGRIELGDGADTETLFCSQLVAQAFQDAGRPIVSVPPNWVAPGDLANLSTGTMASGTLAYVGHLKAPIPSRGFFGIGQALSVAQGVSRALDADDWTVNWDEVQQIPQPTDMGCWSTAASMVLGWRDNQSVDPTRLAQCVSLEQQMQDGLKPAEVSVFANASTLTIQPNACYTPEGFRQLLEANGPIWVAEVVRAPVRFFHAVVVTGMYRSGGAYFVRITDPLDRVVGTPGHPGARTIPPTHTTGSRYIMTYEDFVSEYEAAAGIGVIQLMHSGGAFGHTINRGSAAGVGYALGTGTPAPGGKVGYGVNPKRRTGSSYDVSRALDADDWTINWDEIEMIPQPTDKSCWATAAAMVVGWRDRQSVDPTLLARCARMDSSLSGGLMPADKRAFVNGLGLVIHPNACYTPDGFRQIVEANGPVWVTADVSATPGAQAIHAVVVTGMYRQDGQYYVRITDPWDRVVGTPGAAGSYLTTHNTGSRYIMSWDAFTGEFEAAGNIDRIQLVYAGSTSGHTINRGSAAGVGYALAAAPPLPGGEFGIGVTLTRRTENSTGRSYDLAQLTGLVQPANALAGGAGQPRMAGQRIVLDDWPYIDGPSGRTAAPVTIDWAWQGGAVGDVAISPGQGQMLDGWTAQVRADISRASGAPERASLNVRITTTFRHAGEEDQVAVTDVALSGDGRFKTVHGADSAPPLPVSDTRPAAREVQPA
ncbi:papain-like cysteine protease family protein [Dyella subtropica]|uniref:papain-like cysteine protease family protein n=1 Tax=Dyella subtropica TaxID=2992127 RepID=UPI00225AFE7B|nr:papain-like cysteine protease family protein [Dyella subtropica]